MALETDNFIHMPNPEYQESEFRQNNQQQINQVGEANFGAGVIGRMGLLKGSGKAAPYIFLFKKPKWDMPSVKEWLDKYKGSSFCFECMENFEIEDSKESGIWITAKVTKLNEEFDDNRVIVGLDIPEDKDIPIRDMHSKGVGKTLGFTRKDLMYFNNDGELVVRWKVTDDHTKKLLRDAKHPLKLFQYSPELKHPVRNGNRRSGLLGGIAVTEDPAWLGSGNTEIHFEKWSESNFSKKGGKSMAEDEVMELKLKLQKKDSEIESFERQAKEASDKIEAFEKEKKDLIEKFEADKEDFEKQIETLTTEKGAVEEKFEQLQKDHKDLQEDNEAKAKVIEEFESKEISAKVEEVFELGVQVGRYDKDKADEIKEELFKLSPERLEDKKADYEYFSTKVQRRGVPTPPGRGAGTSDVKDAFSELF